MNRRFFSRLAIGLPWIIGSKTTPVAAQPSAYGRQFVATVGGMPAGQKGESVVGYLIEVTSAKFDGVPNIPLGWRAIIDNNASLHSSIEGSLQLGSAAYSPEDFNIVVSGVVIPLDGLDFELRVQLAFTKDFSEVRLVDLTREQFDYYIK